MIQLFLILTSTLSYTFAANNNLNVQSFGANPDAKTDSTKSFQSAWAAACASTGPTSIYVPSGRYLIGRSIFSGRECKNKGMITIHMDGTLVAPSDYKDVEIIGVWLKFVEVTGLSIIGGTIDGQGSDLWSCKLNAATRSRINSSCPYGPTSLGLYKSNNISIDGLSSVNSKAFHMIIFGCRDAKLNNIRISAPGNSPNTDGIHVQESSVVTINNSRVATGDDCVSVGPGTSNLWIENLFCGPGHGISIGSLGSESQERGVQNVTVKTATLTNTQNGVRIKTWSKPSSGFVKDVLFQHIVIVNARNPIIIDQNYCPTKRNCPNQGSGVKINNVIYQDVQGTSSSKVGVYFDCSKTEHCSGIRLDGIKLTYNSKPVMDSCANAEGNATDVLGLTSCLLE